MFETTQAKKETQCTFIFLFLYKGALKLKQ